MSFRFCTYIRSSKTMAFKVSMILMVLTLVYLTTKYWKIKEENDQCDRHLERQSKLYKDTEKDMRNSKGEFSKLLKKRETEILELSKAKKSVDDKLKMCSIASSEKDKKMEAKVILLEDKEVLIEEKNGKIDQLQLQLKQTRTEFNNIVIKEEEWKTEKEKLEINLSKIQKENNLLQSKVNNFEFEKDKLVKAAVNDLRVKLEKDFQDIQEAQIKDSNKVPKINEPSEDKKADHVIDENRNVNNNLKVNQDDIKPKIYDKELDLDQELKNDQNLKEIDTMIEEEEKNAEVIVKPKEEDDNKNADYIKH